MDARPDIFKALSNETRLRIVEFLLDGERCVCEIIPITGRAQSTTSLQLAKLESLGILSSRRDGKRIMYRICNDDVFKVLRCFKK
ncbi:MAG: winged helix-turn-helix transcriptional regulator [Candidatus Altiarchaeota archaeon]|nr:winged helix-turn-helix transcriptional regulator [Candidatus Altiarchaeota archaeon]